MKSLHSPGQVSITILDGGSFRCSTESWREAIVGRRKASPVSGMIPLRCDGFKVMIGIPWELLYVDGSPSSPSRNIKASRGTVIVRIEGLVQDLDRFKLKSTYTIHLLAYDREVD